MIRVFPETRALGTCQGCGDSILWLRTIAGAMIPMQVDAVPAWTERDLLEARELDVYHGGSSHWSNCPTVEKFRRKRAARRPSSLTTSQERGDEDRDDRQHSPKPERPIFSSAAFHSV
jgi:hypothetical protein